MSEKDDRNQIGAIERNAIPLIVRTCIPHYKPLQIAAN